jgi:hypothetical protein
MDNGEINNDKKQSCRYAGIYYAKIVGGSWSNSGISAQTASTTHHQDAHTAESSYALSSVGI